MVIGFLDDTEIQITDNTKQPDIYVSGGFFIDQDRLCQLMEGIAELKISKGLKPWYPIKWNLKDLKAHYEKRGEREVYDLLLQESDDIRLAALKLLSRFRPTVMACGLYRLSAETRNVDCHRWAFENLLQRIGLMLQNKGPIQRGGLPAQIVLDWPQGGVRKELFDIYAAGYHHGRAVDSKQNYYSGPLKELGLADGLLCSSTIHSAPLQLADLVVGCVKDFLAWCYKDTNRGRVTAFFPVIAESLHRSREGIINGYGLKVSGVDIDLDAKIEELCPRGDSMMTNGEEIPF
jgi:hypothetical protein